VGLGDGNLRFSHCVATVSMVTQIRPWLIVFDSYNKSPVLAILKTWGVPEWLLVVWPVLCGICIIALPARWRRPVHLTAFPFWIFVAFAIFQRDIALTAIPVYAAIGILHAGNFLLSRDE
jgi:hypothetical protein